ncbi:MAG: HlyD family secretion protein, partial [Xenococcaceae cyanobacterium]
PVKIKLDAFPYQDYGVVSGKVTNISADSKDDKKLGEVYRVEVQLDRNYVFNERNKIEFKAGQTGNAEIIIRHRRVADVLLEPIKQMQKDGLNL